MTIDSGYRTEVLGPLFYRQENDTEKTWAFPPLLSYNTDSAINRKSLDLLYPILTYERYDTQYRWQFVQLFSFAGGEEPNDHTKKRFTIFPFYFHQSSPIASENYTAVFPFYGHIQGRLFRDDIFFVMFPIYGETQKKDVITENYLYPFFHLRHGNGLNGWQLWPIVGHEHKDITTRTNGFGDVEITGGHDKSFLFWPIYFDQITDIGTGNPQDYWGVLPFYAQSRSPLRDSTSVFWPFFNWIDDRKDKYHEKEIPWPFIVFARGEGKTTSRVWPFFGYAQNSSQESDFYLWPVYKYNRFHAETVDRRETRILFYLYRNVHEQNLETKKERGRIDFWPLFTRHRDFDGDNRLQILALIEPFLPNNEHIGRDWSPLWSLWRSENNPQTGVHSQSLLWNLYRRDTTPTSKKCSLLLGLFRYQSDAEMKRLRLFYIPVFKSHKQTGELKG
ncbi:MAG TPA: hypothetical protein VHG89_02990 [Verrucomicrobiae bacterium]|nr:hypothetical protein [Verrucomicrobiae bacterium]